MKKFDLDSSQPKGREYKNRLRDLLRRFEPEKAFEMLGDIPTRQVVNPLFSFLYSMEPLLKWKAVTALGMAVDSIARENLESARTVMRRLMWNLNDESGGIGWGSPEAMGEIIARNPAMAEEYVAILVSYIDPEGNYLETEGLQQGVLWAIGRVAKSRPTLIRFSLPLLLPFLNAANPTLRGLATWASGLMESEAVKPRLMELTHDPTEIELWIDGIWVKRPIEVLAKAALDTLSRGESSSRMP